MSNKPTPIHASPIRDKILGAVDLPVVEMPIPRWDTTIVVKGAPAAHPRYIAFVESPKGASLDPKTGQPTDREKQIRRNVGAVIMSALDPDTGEQLFNWSDADELREKHYNTVLTIAAKAFELAGGDSPTDWKAQDAVGYLLVYGESNGWTNEEMDHLMAVSEVVAKNITQAEEAGEDSDVSRETSDDTPETDEVASDGPLDPAS